MLLPRIATALIGAPVILGAIYHGGLPFFFVILAVVLIGLREFYYLAAETGYPSFDWIGVGGGALVIASIFLNGIGFASATENQLTAGVFSLLLLVVVVRSLSKGPADTTLSEWGITFLGVFYVAWTMGHLLLLRDLKPQGLPATFLLFAIIWTEDICAYFVGSRWGRRKIAESISPKKSWEGTIAGILAAMAVAVLFQKTVLKSSMSTPEAMLLGAVTAILGFFSDLGESLIKRAAGVKDSSLLLPGHGGILDRFDSFFLACPFFYYYWAFVKH